MQKTPRSGLKDLISIFWNLFGVLHDRLFEMSPTVTNNTYYNKRTEVTDKYRSRFGATVKSSGPFSDKVNENEGK